MNPWDEKIIISEINFLWSFTKNHFSWLNLNKLNKDHVYLNFIILIILVSHNLTITEDLLSYIYSFSFKISSDKIIIIINCISSDKNTF